MTDAIPDDVVTHLHLAIPPNFKFSDLRFEFHPDLGRVSFDGEVITRLFQESGYTNEAIRALPSDVVQLVIRAWYNAALDSGELPDGQMEAFIQASGQPVKQLRRVVH